MSKQKKNLPADAQFALLNKWVDFLEDNATVLVVTVPDEVGAFRMFETLNDRGLRASQADILKNYFFSKSGRRYAEAQMMWSSITAALDAISLGEKEREFDEEDDIDKHDLLITYNRHH